MNVRSEIKFNYKMGTTFFCALIILLTSCKYSIKLVEKSSYKLSLPAQASTVSNFQGKDVILWFDDEHSKIHIKSLFDKSLDSSMSIPINKSGQYDCRMAPQQGVWITKLTFSDVGSILCTEYNSKDIVEIRNDSIFSYTYNLPYKDFSRSGGFASNIIQFGDTLVLNLSSISNHFQPEEPRTICITNWRGSNPKYHFLHPLPSAGSKEYPVFGWIPMNYLAVKDGMFYSSFEYSDSIFISRLDGGSQTRIDASAHIPLNNSYFKNPDEYFKHPHLDRFKDLEKYHRLIYDPYNKLFYRIIARKTILESNEDNLVVNFKPFQILVFDSDFKKIDEIDFTDKYLFRWVYPTSKGLLVGYNENPMEKATVERIVLFNVKKRRQFGKSEFSKTNQSVGKSHP